MFPADDAQRAADAEETIEKLSDKVDYLIVDNIERNREKLDAWNRSELRSYLVDELGAAEVRLPSLWEELKMQVNLASELEGRPLGFAEAASRFDLVSRIFY